MNICLCICLHAGALHNLAVNDEEAQEAVATAGAIPPLISLMQNASPDLQAKAAATIWSIAGEPSQS